MRFVSYLIAGFFVASFQAAMAEEPPAPSRQDQPALPADKNEDAESHPPTDLPEELKEIRRALGPDYSVESWQPDLRSHASQDRTTSASYSQEQKDLFDKVKALDKEFRESARRLESLAAEAEESELYHIADRLRTLARQQWEAARELRNPQQAGSNLYGPPITYYGHPVTVPPGHRMPSYAPDYPQHEFPPAVAPSSSSPWRTVEPSVPRYPAPKSP